MILSLTSINWARTHIENFYDSDFFPKPFEFSGLWANWHEVSSYLSSTDLKDIVVKKPRVLPAPKNAGGFRMVHQLDPIDALIYTALVYSVADILEQARVPESENVVFSYRIKTDDKGNFFTRGNGYSAFKERSVELAKTYKHVLITDITDFYNQIYHHRLQNAIEMCGPNFSEISKAIENFLMDLTNRVSRGVPVGPAPSIILSEALLIDIDQYLAGKNVKYTRYADDFRIFSNSTRDLLTILHNLTEYLYASHRLVPSSAKTRIRSSKRFIEEYIDDPEGMEKNRLHQSILDLDMFAGDLYNEWQITDFEELPNRERLEAQAGAFKSIVVDIADKRPLDLGLARHVLRRAKALRSRALVPTLLTRFDKFCPVIRDVVIYLEAVVSEEIFASYVPELERLIKSSVQIELPLIRLWMAHFLSQYRATVKSDILKTFVSNDSLRSAAILAKNEQNVAWVREHKDKLDQYGIWDRRAILHASQALSRDERSKWMSSVLRQGDLVERSLAKYLRSSK